MPRRHRLPLALAVIALLAFAPAAHAVETGLVVGPRTNGENVDQLDRASRSGAEWVRIFVDWSAAEPERGRLEELYERASDQRDGRAGAMGLKVLMVVTRSPSWASGAAEPDRPPRDAADYASFLRHLAERYRSRVDAWEIWNEPDEAAFWAPAPDAPAYAGLLKAAYLAVKSADPGAAVVLGGLTGNHYRFLEEVYTAGGKGAFDAVGVHTDTACLTSPPVEQYREPDGRIGRFSFTGYREVRRTMLRNGDDKPVWMTELGWSTLTSTCRVGARARTKPSGVSEDRQADLLTAAYRCLQGDPYVAVALWFSVQDVDRSSTRYDHRLGLLRDDGTRKPAYEAFRTFSRDASRPTARCGADVDEQAPTVHIVSPAAGQPYLDRLVVSARAEDDQGVARMELYADGAKVPGGQRGGRFRLHWDGARRLGIGRHTLTVRASDAAGNVGEASVEVERSEVGRIAVGPVRLSFSARRLGGRDLELSGRARAPRSPIAPKGRVRMLLDVRRGDRRQPYSRYTKGVARSFHFRVTLRRAGTWRIRVRFVGFPPFRDAAGPTRPLGRFG